MMLAFYEPERQVHVSELFEVAAAELARQSIPGSEISLRMAAALRGIEEPEKFQRLLVEYTRLFLNPMGAVASPYLSGWKELLGDDVVERYLAFFQMHGFRMAEDFSDLPEHMAAVLEAYLNLAQTDPGEARKLWENILVVWVPAFGQRLSEQADEDFYREFGIFLVQWADAESGKWKGQ